MMKGSSLESCGVATAACPPEVETSVKVTALFPRQKTETFEALEFVGRALCVHLATAMNQLPLGSRSRLGQKPVVKGYGPGVSET